MTPRSRQRAHNQNTRGIDVFLTLLRQLGTLGLYTHLNEMGLTTAEIAMLDIASKDLGWKMVEDHVAKGKYTKPSATPNPTPNPTLRNDGSGSVGPTRSYSTSFPI
jgi:hypothetical protein